MTDTDQPTEAPAPKPKRKPWHRAASAKPLKPEEFAGLTPTNCCDACRPGRCVISGADVCAHPFKGGLQAELMRNPAVFQRHRRATQTLQGQTVKV